MISVLTIVNCSGRSQDLIMKLFVLGANRIPKYGMPVKINRDSTLTRV
jgi:hypothetical protein